MDVLGNYRILEEIGRGAYATVFRAMHVNLGSEVALKLLNPLLSSDPHARQRFLQEAKVISTLDHPNIVRILDLDEEQDKVFFTMEYLGGGDLGRWCAAHSPKRPVLLRILGEVSAALDYAHARDLLHRDVKPGNILIDAGGTAHLADFGLVRVLNSPHLSSLGSIVGTALYLAPEQAEGRNLDGRADQYALGVVAYELLAGRPPFQGETATAISLLHISQPPPAPSSLCTELGPEVDEVLLKVLAKNPGGRYPSCTAFVTALRSALDEADLRRFRQLTTEAKTLMADGAFDECRQRLEAAANLLPNRPELAGALAESLAELARVRRQAESYEQLTHHWQQALLKAQAVLEAYPDYPDPQGVFVALGLHSAPRPALTERLRQVGAGLLVGLLAGGTLLSLIFRYWIAG